jgi:nicotinamide mononucleotide (NMN) deamidase PncC
LLTLTASNRAAKVTGKMFPDSAELTRLIKQIHDSPQMIVIVIAGGGARVLADLSAVPGASRTLLEAQIPYCERALVEFLQYLPRQAVSVETAAALAHRAFERARHLMPDEEVPVIGVSCTAALVTDRPKKGQHRLHVGICGKDGSRVYSLILTKGARTRVREERVAADMVLYAIAGATGLHFALDLGLLPEEEVRVH